MVVSCQKCRTRFQLDAGRIPAKGVRVRCSKCKHAFFVAPPGKDDDTIHGLAQQAAREGRPAKPRLDASIDLPPVSSGEPEDDWQFNIDPPGGAGAAGGRAGAREVGDDRTPPPAEITDSEPTEAGAVDSFFELDGLSDPGPELHHHAAPEPTTARAETSAEPAGKAAKGRKPVPAPLEPEQEVTFEDLGSPESWDFGVPEPSRSAKAAPAVQAKPAAKAKAKRSEAAREPAAAASRLHASPRLRADGWTGALAGAAGWLLALTLFGFGVNGALPSAGAGRGTLPTLQVGALELAELRVRHVENLHGGPLVVVSGELRNATDAPVQGVAPRLRIRDASGRPLDVPPEWLGVSPTPEELREADPAALRAALERTARAFGSHLFAPQVGVPVAAVLSALPPEAESFLVEAAPP